MCVAKREERFCRAHLDEYENILKKELEEVETEHDELRDKANGLEQNPMEHPLLIVIMLVLWNRD